MVLLYTKEIYHYTKFENIQKGIVNKILWITLKSYIEIENNKLFVF